MKLNKIYCEDCRNTMKRIPDNYIDLIITSPPYDDLRDYHGCKWNMKIFKEVAKELFRIIKPGGVIVWVVGDKTNNGSESGTSFRQALYFKKIGFNLHDTMIYQKKNVLPLCGRRYEQAFEYMFVISKNKPKTYNPIKELKLWEDKRTIKQCGRNKDGSKVIGFSKQSPYKVKINVWAYKTGGGNVTKDKIAYKHPAIFPEQLAADHIYSWSNEGDLIYDPFGGSGTVAKKAIQMKRNWIISEISKEYCDITEKRIKPYLQQLTLAI